MEEEGIPDKYDGPSASQIASYQRMMRFRDNLVNIFVIGLYNTCIASMLRKKTDNDENIEDGKIKYLSTSIPPNTPRIVDTLMRVHGYQLLVDGLFNADPHGGNFLLMDGSD